MVSDWWVALSGVSVRGLNQHFLALSWKWLYSQRMPAGQGTGNLSVLGRMEFFTLSVCMSASCFSFSNSCAKSTSQTGTGHGHTSCQQILWQSLPTGEWEPEPELSDCAAPGSHPSQNSWNTQKCFRAEQEADGLGQNVTDQPQQKHWCGNSGSFSAVTHVVWVLSTLLINAGTTIQVAKADGKVSQLTDKKGKKIVFLSFLMHWSVWLLQEMLSPFTMSHWEQHSTDSTAREILSFALQKKLYFTAMPLADLLITDLTIFWEIKWNEMDARSKRVKEKD